jgi:hypothetical protein
MMHKAKRLHRQFVGAALSQGLSFFERHSRLRQRILTIVRKLGLHPIAVALYAKLAPGSVKSDSGTSQGPLPTNVSQLTPRARQIYDDLKIAIEQCQKEKG